MIRLITFNRSDSSVGNTFALRISATPRGRASGRRRVIEPGSMESSGRCYLQVIKSKKPARWTDPIKLDGFMLSGYQGLGSVLYRTQPF